MKRKATFVPPTKEKTVGRGGKGRENILRNNEAAA